MTKVEETGLGGTLNVHFLCSGCEIRSLAFQGSSLVECSKRTVTGLALGVAFFLREHSFANFERTLKQYLGCPMLIATKVRILLMKVERKIMTTIVRRSKTTQIFGGHQIRALDDKDFNEGVGMRVEMANNVAVA